MKIIVFDSDRSHSEWRDQFPAAEIVLADHPEEGFRFVEEWDENGTPIAWQKEGRKQLNPIIRRYNEWQIEGFNVEDGKKLRGVITQGLQTFARHDGGSAWQKELEEMLVFVESFI